MDVFVVLWLIISVVGIIVGASKKKTAQARQQSRPVMAPREGSSGREGTSAETDAQRRARQEELKRRLEENARRRAEEAKRAIPGTASQRTPLEKPTMRTQLQKERPVVAHREEDCGGGSIHDGYHEGVTKFASREEASVAGNLGRRLADEDERIDRETAVAENAKRAVARISKLPPLTQAVVWSEILGKPKSETA